MKNTSKRTYKRNAHKNSKKVTYISQNKSADIRLESASRSIDNNILAAQTDDSQDILEIPPAGENLLKIAQSFLDRDQKLLAIYRRCALNHAAWKSNNLEQDLIKIKFYLSEIEKDKERIKEAQEVILFLTRW
jgi:hypothetical protein